MALLAVLLVSTPVVSTQTMQLGGNLTFDWVKSDRLVYALDFEPRGSALAIAADLASTPVSGIRVQCCGDAHLSNFGGFATPERRLLFSINGLDETLPAPWEWDVKPSPPASWWRAAIND